MIGIVKITRSTRAEKRLWLLVSALLGLHLVLMPSRRFEATMTEMIATNERSDEDACRMMNMTRNLEDVGKLETSENQSI
jgi:hypothetical protein